MKLKIALKKQTGTAATYFVYSADLQMDPDVACIDVCDTYTDLLLRHGEPTWFFTRGGGEWAVLPVDKYAE